MFQINIKGIFALCSMLFLGFGLQAQSVSNDVCAAAIPMSSAQTISGTTIGATTDGLTNCGTSITAPGVWYMIIGNGGPLTASTCNQASYDTKISIFSGSCTNLVCEGGNDDGSGCTGFSSEATILTQAGTSYFILVHGFLSATGTFDLTTTLGNAPTGNDACGGALPINCGDTVTGTTVNATFDASGTCTTSNTAPGVWYQIQGTGSPIVASLCSGTAYDSKLSVFSGSCGNMTCVTGNDDFCGLQSLVALNTDPSLTYFILVHGFGSATGSFTLDINCPAAPTNDYTCDAIPLSFGTFTYNHFGLSTQANEPSPGAGTGASSCDSQDGWCSFELGLDNTAWFTFIAPPSGTVSIVADGFDSQLAVYDAVCCTLFNQWVLMAANDDGASNIISTAGIFSAGINQLSCLTPGAEYYIQVDGFNGAEAIGAQITLIDDGGMPLSANVGGCQTRFLGYAPAEADTNFLLGTASGGLAPYTYTWTGGTALIREDLTSTSSIGTQPGTTTTYTFTVTDARGCTASDEVVVNVMDVTCGNNILVCNSTMSGSQLLCVSAADVAGYLANLGSHLGICGNPCLNSNPSIVPPPPCVDLIVSVTTDDFGSETSWNIVDLVTGQVIGSRSFAFGDNNITANDTFCVNPNHCYDVTILDAFGDGICCAFGFGSWQVSLDGVTTFSPTGGAFASSETISVGAGCASKIQESSSNTSSNALKAVAYPNPASNLVNIKFSSSVTSEVSLDIFSITGEKVKTIFNGLVNAGESYLEDVRTENLPNGVYFYRLTNSEEVKTGKIQVIH